MPPSDLSVTEVLQVIVDRYSRDELRRVVATCLNEDYDLLVSPDKPYGDQAFDFVQWAKRKNRLQELADCLGRAKPKPAPGESPYKGLAYYTAADAALFFGRETLTAELVTYLKDHRFLAIIGASGSGKSSVVRAGVVPVLQQGQVIQGSDQWALHVVTPTARPLQALAAELTKDSESVTAQSTLMDDMAKDARSLDLFSSRLLARSGAARLLLVVDQFEELFTLCNDHAEQQAYIDNLLAAAVPQGCTTVVLTLRADFYARCAEFANLRKAVQDCQKYIGPMFPENLRATIEQPAQANGWDFEPGLVDAILADVEGEAGSLPLLSHALLETWKRRSGRTLTFAGYHAAGGVQGAIAKTADSVYAALPPDQQAIARNIFLRLTTLGEGAQDTRRRAPLSELLGVGVQAAEVQAVLKRLEDERLVTAERSTTTTAGGESKPEAVYVDVTHEALIREWPTLTMWLHEDREGLLVHRRLTMAAQGWQDLRRDPGELFRGARLAQTAEWAAMHQGELSNQEREFLVASREQAEAEQRDKQRIEQEREESRLRELDQALQLAATAEARRQAEEERALEAEARQQAELQRAEEAEAREKAETARAGEAEARRAAEEARAVEAEMRREAEEERARQAEQSAKELARSAGRLRKRAWYLGVALVLAIGAVLATGFYYFEAQRSATEANLQRQLADGRINQFGKAVGNLGLQRILAVADELRADGDSDGSKLLIQTAVNLTPGLLSKTVLSQLSKEQLDLVTNAISYVYIPAGEFKLGSDSKTDLSAQGDEQPQHMLTLPGFWIMRTEVTNRQYRRCVEEGVCTEPQTDRWADPAYADHPVTNVTWRQANEYAAWAGGRLPTEAEWEKACRGTDGRIYPWGDSAPTAELANYAHNVGSNVGSNVADTTSVGKYSPQGDSQSGLADMAGNVWEWTSSEYKTYPYDPSDGREDPTQYGQRTLRGGSWHSGGDSVRCARRDFSGPDLGGSYVGFRVVSFGF